MLLLLGNHFTPRYCHQPEDIGIIGEKIRQLNDPKYNHETRDCMSKLANIIAYYKDPNQ